MYAGQGTLPKPVVASVEPAVPAAAQQQNPFAGLPGWVGKSPVQNTQPVIPSAPTFEEQLQKTPSAPEIDFKEILERRKAGLGGYSSEEAAAQRAQMALGLGRQQEAARRQLLAAQAKSGIKGGAAAAQQGRFAEQAMAQRAGGEQELFVKNIAEQQRRLKEYEDIQKAQQFGNLAAQLTRWQMAQAESAAAKQVEAARIAAQGQVEAARTTKIICTELYHQGLMDHGTFEADQAFGRIMWQKDPAVMVGYHAWARPLVKLMKRSKIFTRIVAFFALPWAKEMDHRMGAQHNGSKFGRALMAFGVPFCRMIGKAIKKQGLEVA